MANKDKIIAAFLASVGIFTSAQALTYVKSLSENEKNSLLPAAQVTDSNVFLCSGSAVNEAVVETEPADS